MSAVTVRPSRRTELSHPRGSLVRVRTLNRSKHMSNGTEREIAVLRGSARVRSVWLSPTPSGVAGHPQSPLPSEGQWVERQPNTYARQQVTVPVTVGSSLRIF